MQSTSDVTTARTHRYVAAAAITAPLTCETRHASALATIEALLSLSQVSHTATRARAHEDAPRRATPYAERRGAPPPADGRIGASAADGGAVPLIVAWATAFRGAGGVPDAISERDAACQRVVARTRWSGAAGGVNGGGARATAHGGLLGGRVELLDLFARLDAGQLSRSTESAERGHLSPQSYRRLAEEIWRVVSVP